MIGAILGGFTILGVFLTLASWVNGRSIKKVLTEVIERIDEKAAERHQEVVLTLKQQHQDVVELLKKGFGDLSQHRANLRI